jgi:phage shock protein PspC (stress-responsive transcriptional regulator)
MNTTATNPQSSTPIPTDGGGSSRPGPRSLRRPFEDRMLAGVAAGLAHYLGVDVTIVRIVIAVLAITGPGLPLYLDGWLLIPEDGADQSIAAEFIASLQTRSH